MQGISVLGLVAERRPHPRTPPLREVPLFQTVFLPRHNFFGRGLLLSAILHSLCIFGGPPLLDLLPESDAEALKRLSMRSLEIRIPERLYLPAMPEPAKPPAAPPARPETPKPVELAKSQIQPPSLPRARAERIPPPEFKLPERVRRVNDGQTLIQSHLPPELALESRVKLPQLVLMSAPMLPRPEPRRFVEPGRSAAPTVAPRVDAPPQLAPSSTADSDLKIASMLAGPEQAVLRLPKPTVQAKPFQVPAPIPSGRGASVSPTLGEPISILALSADPAPLQEHVILPVGNQISRLLELPAYPAPIEPNAGTGKPGSAGPKSGTNAAGTASAGAGGGQALLGELAKALAALPAKYATPIQIIHPVSAVFDVVVQTATDQAVPESVGALSGQPIYTVYLEVGAPKAWLLQYCIPRDVSDAPKIVAGAVNIGNPTPLKAPFPLVTVLPPVTMLPRTSYIIVHGFVDTTGQIKNPLVLRTPNASFKGSILAELSKWQFRPAVRDGAPVAVEVLLAIPPQQL